MGLAKRQKRRELKEKELSVVPQTFEFYTCILLVMQQMNTSRKNTSKALKNRSKFRKLEQLIKQKTTVLIWDL